MSFIEDMLNAIVGLKTSKIVSCPINPIEVPGIGATIESVNDCMGTIVTLPVPKSGRLVSATFWDLDYEKTQVDIEIFKQAITQIADNAAWAPSDTDILQFVTEINFYSFDDHINNATSAVFNIGLDYTAPGGVFYIQAVTRSTPTIVTTPRFQLQIESLDPDFVEV